MAFHHLLRNLRATARGTGLRKLETGIAFIREYSASGWNASDTCRIRGASQDILFRGVLLESLAEHEATYPLVQKIPDDELITLDPARQYEISDHWRPMLHSGFIQSYLCKTEKDCINNPFDYNNVGVIKGLNILAFKKFVRIEGKVNSDHKGYTGFLEDTFSRFCGSSPLPEQFPECQQFIEACNNATDSDDEVLLHHSFFLDDEPLADLYTEIHRLLRNEFRHRNLGRQAMKILRKLNEDFSNHDVVRYCLRHLILHSLLGAHCPAQVKKSVLQSLEYRPPTDGAAVVDIHRNAVQHAIETDVLNAALLKRPNCKDLLKKYTRIDLIKALRYMYSTYPGEAIVAFKDEEVLHHLGMDRRLPMDKLYGYIPPDTLRH